MDSKAHPNSLVGNGDHHHLLGASASGGHQLAELLAKAQGLKRENNLLLSQLARASKCLNAVMSENTLLKQEVASLHGTPIPDNMKG